MAMATQKRRTPEVQVRDILNIATIALPLNI
jgi:hypothetical protein